MISEYDLNVQELVSVDKVSRLIRQMATKHHLVKDPRKRREIKEILDECEYQFFQDNYDYLYKRYKTALSIPRASSTKDSPYKDYIYDLSYAQVRASITQKTLLQVKEWHETGTKIIFQTLTINNSHMERSEVSRAIRGYRRDLQDQDLQYIIVFERGSETGRIHFHALHAKSENRPVSCHGRWNAGFEDHKIVRYLNDGFTPNSECLENNWSIDSVSHYIAKYIAKDDSDILDGFTYRTSMSRGFGTNTLRMKLCQTTTKILTEMYQQGINNYLIPFQTEVRLELARRAKKTTQRLKSLDSTPGGSAFRDLLSMAPRDIGPCRGGATAEPSDYGFNYWLKKNHGY